MYNEIITLVDETKTVDSYGDTNVTRTSRDVFAELKSIGQAEFYQAYALGLKPEIKFVLPDYLEYKNEKIVLYRGYTDEEDIEYKILRTYRNGNSLEIVCSRGVDQ